MEFERDPNNLNVNILNSAKEDLELFYKEKVKGIIIHARARWHENAEKSTKYFLNLEKKKSHQKTYAKIENQWFNYYRPLRYIVRTTTLLPRVVHEHK